VKQAGFWTKDWLLGLAVAIVLFLFAGSDLLQSLERKAYDMGVRAADRGAPSDRIAVIAIDDASIRNIGRWPWPRDVHAKLTDHLAAGKAKVVVSLVFFTEPQIDPGLAYVNRLIGEYRKAVPDPNAVDQGSPLSLAVSLYQLLCGRLPFDGESMAQLMFRIANEPAPQIRQFNPKLPPGLVAFLARAMAKEAGEPYQTGEEFAQSLRACVGGATPRAQVDINV
jgi:serine/threonine protein kinase